MRTLFFMFLFTAFLVIDGQSALSQGEDMRVPPIDMQQPEHVETATFALGWFWGPDSQFGSIPGVIRTRVGYSGGAKQSPTYHDLGDHTETIEIDYDPSVISYRDLLDEFWQAHNPTSNSWSRQYMNAVFYRNDEQKRLALETMEREKERLGTSVKTKILPFTSFTLAEDYHQKHALRRFTEVLGTMIAYYRDIEGFVNSTAVTRLNGFLGGYGYFSNLEKEIDSYGLPPELRDSVLETAKKVLAKQPLKECPVN